MPRWIFFSLMLTLVAAPAHAQPLVAPTDPLTPAEQRQHFKLPAGFEIELVASEPDIHKPMNLKFDSQGRLWVTHSLEYPFPAATDAAARDQITVFSEFASDGRAGRAERFADHLNIPIGILPLPHGTALAWSIPNIYRLVDTDGDGQCDERSILFGPFGISDTHGNQNSFTRWVDGWIYANHGFNNHSQAKRGGEGPVLVDMQSGNTYRFRPDGSAIEQFSWGQVNPFGLSFDPLGNLYSADCHSRAVTMLLREGYYQSFGKPHDGLGFAPDTTDIDHGGTGIAGVCYYAAEQFPPEFRDVLFVGNVITNRVHCDRLRWQGSSPTVEKVEDFLVCSDPWFRPVDIQLGPDGALYIADFYNRIIGHYEVPLTHPGRDRERGRIWRVVYRPHGGPSKEEAAGKPTNLAEAPPQALARELGNPNLAIRTLATNALLDRFEREAAQLVEPLFQANRQDKRSVQELPFRAEFARAHAIWILRRVNQLDETHARRLAQDDQPIVRVHLIAALGDTAEWQPWQFGLVRAALADPDPFVRRAATTALAAHPAAENLRSLLRLQRETAAPDTQLAHATRIALRDQLRASQVAEELAKLSLTAEERQQLISVAALAPTGPGALLIYQAALAGEVPPGLLAEALPAAARYIAPEQIDALIELVERRQIGDAEYRLNLLRVMHEALAQRGQRPTQRLLDSLTAGLKAMLTDANDGQTWTNQPLPESAGQPASPSPWIIQPRDCRDGQNQVSMLSSLPSAGGASERLTGIARSPNFTLPAELSFWMCGHNGPPGSPDAQRNFTRLVLDDGSEVARSYPPRSDLAERFSWDLTKYVGSKGYVEVVDGLGNLDGFAWLAVSRFEPALLRIPAALDNGHSQRLAAVKLAGQLRLEQLAEQVSVIANKSDDDGPLQLAAADALVRLQPAAAIAPLARLLAASQQPVPLRQQAAELLGRIDRSEARQPLADALPAAPAPVAVAIAAALAAQPASAGNLLELVKAGKASAALLNEATVVERLRALNSPEIQRQVAELTAGLSPADDRLTRLIAERRAGFLAGTFDPEAGRAVFARSVCKNCHRAADIGGNLGPALDGIGNRGLDRLLEDLLDPNRNVDQAFRVRVFATDSGNVVSGFNVREEGKTLVFFDSNGQQVRLPLDEIADQRTSNLSPMPANLSDIMPAEDFYSLLAYLLSQRAK